LDSQGPTNSSRSVASVKPGKRSIVGCDSCREGRKKCQRTGPLQIQSVRDHVWIFNPKGIICTTDRSACVFTDREASRQEKSIVTLEATLNQGRQSLSTMGSQSTAARSEPFLSSSTQASRLQKLQQRLQLRPEKVREAMDALRDELASQSSAASRVSDSSRHKRGRFACVSCKKKKRRCPAVAPSGWNGDPVVLRPCATCLKRSIECVYENPRKPPARSLRPTLVASLVLLA
jgi:hypothetical protein